MTQQNIMEQFPSDFACDSASEISYLPMPLPCMQECTVSIEKPAIRISFDSCSVIRPDKAWYVFNEFVSCKSG